MLATCLLLCPDTQHGIKVLLKPTPSPNEDEQLAMITKDAALGHHLHLLPRPQIPLLAQNPSVLSLTTTISRTSSYPFTLLVYNNGQLILSKCAARLMSSN
jgi:hypothetical protein